MGQRFEFIYVVEISRHWTNQVQVTDLIDFCLVPTAVDFGEIRRLYEIEKFSASQIAKRFEVSKAKIIACLHKLGIRNNRDRGFDKNNFCRTQSVPFGKKVVGGKLLIDKNQLETARLIVKLRSNKDFEWKKIVDYLHKKGLKTKTGSPWKIGTVRATFVNFKNLGKS